MLELMVVSGDTNLHPINKYKPQGWPYTHPLLKTLPNTIAPINDWALKLLIFGPPHQVEHASKTFGMTPQCKSQAIASANSTKKLLCIIPPLGMLIHHLVEP